MYIIYIYDLNCKYDFNDYVFKCNGFFVIYKMYKFGFL